MRHCWVTYELFVVEVTRSNKAESLLLVRLAVVVVVGDSDGHAHATRHRACTPRRALTDTPFRLLYSTTQPTALHRKNIRVSTCHRFSVFQRNRFRMSVFVNRRNGEAQVHIAMQTGASETTVESIRLLFTGLPTA